MSTYVKKEHLFTNIQKTFAKQFIHRKLEEFADPVRTGKPRGTTIGLNISKYSAALFIAIYELSTTEIEQILDIPRGLISKWRTEKLFIRERELLLGEFASELDAFVTAGVCEPLFEDAVHYNEKIKLKIVGFCDDAVAKGDHDRLFRYWPLLKTAYGAIC